MVVYGFLKMGSQKNYRIVLLLNEGYKTTDCKLPNGGLWKKVLKEEFINDKKS
jgi:hypothetical protein